MPEITIEEKIRLFEVALKHPWIEKEEEVRKNQWLEKEEVFKRYNELLQLFTGASS